MTKLTGEIRPILKGYLTDEQIDLVSAEIGVSILQSMLEIFGEHANRFSLELLEYMLDLGINVDIAKLIAAKQMEIVTT